MPEAAEFNTTVFAISFGLYTMVIVAVGLYSARFARRSDEDYFLAGRSLGGWVAALSASASSESGWVTLGLVGWAFGSGVSAYWIIPGCLCGFLFNWFVIAGRLRDQSIAFGALTLPDYFSYRFRERIPILRVMSVLVILTAMLLYVSAQMAAAGKAFSASFGGVDFKTGVLIGAGIVLLYTVIGGFRAVCWTDFLQALLMVGTLVVFPIYLLLAEGGFSFITEQLRALEQVQQQAGDAPVGLLHYIPLSAQGSLAALLGFLFGSGALGINFGYPGQPHVLVRFMALKDRRAARIGGVVSAVWAALVYFGAVTVGLMARAMTVAGESMSTADTALAQALTADPDTGLVVSAMYMLPGVLAGVVLAAVLAAICSTADSQLVVAASSAANDLWARLFSKNPEASHVWVNRSVVLALGVGAMWLVIGRKAGELKIYEYVLDYGWALLGASFGPQVILALLWRRASYVGCIAGMLAGFTAAFVCKYYYDNTYHCGVYGDIHMYNLTVGFLVAMAVNVVVSLITPSRAPDAGLVPTEPFDD